MGNRVQDVDDVHTQQSTRRRCELSQKSPLQDENDHIESLTGTLCATTRQERGSHANSINRDQLTWVIKVIVEEAL